MSLMNKKLHFIGSKLLSRLRRSPSKGQSLIELALVLPVMILMLLGIAEGALFMGRYLDLLDLTREAAREASRDDPFAQDVALGNPPSTMSGNKTCATSAASAGTNFYYKAACIFSPPTGSSCQDSDFCDGFNRYVNFDITRDDVVISAYTIENSTTVSQTWPNAIATPGHDPWWALSTDGGFVGNTYTNSNGISVVAHVNNFKYDCQGNYSAGATPQFTAGTVGPQLNTNYGAPPGKGYVAVEVYYCYRQVLAIPIFTNFVPNPIRIHAYTIMPLPNAIPTPVP
jgi:hypothetical protein